MLSTVVWLAALPLVVLRFHMVSPIGILLNVPLIPLTSLALLAAGLTLLLSAVWAPLGVPAAWVCAADAGLDRPGRALGAARRWGHAFVPAPPWGWVLGYYVLLAPGATAAGRWRWPGGGRCWRD